MLRRASPRRILKLTMLPAGLSAAGLAGGSCGRLRKCSAFTRMRRSLKPKRVVLISEALAPLAARFSEAELGCPLILDNGKPFSLDAADASRAVRHLRQVLGLAAAGV